MAQLEAIDLAKFPHLQPWPYGRCRVKTPDFPGGTDCDNGTPGTDAEGTLVWPNPAKVAACEDCQVYNIWVAVLEGRTGTSMS